LHFFFLSRVGAGDNITKTYSKFQVKERFATISSYSICFIVSKSLCLLWSIEFGKAELLGRRCWMLPRAPPRSGQWPKLSAETMHKRSMDHAVGGLELGFDCVCERKKVLKVRQASMHPRITDWVVTRVENQQ